MKDDPTTPTSTRPARSTTPVWHAKSKVPAPDDRKIFTTEHDGTAVPFRWASLDDGAQDRSSVATALLGQARLELPARRPHGRAAQRRRFRDRNIRSVLG